MRTARRLRAATALAAAIVAGGALPGLAAPVLAAPVLPAPVLPAPVPGGPVLAAPQPGEPASLGYTTYDQPAEECTPTDPRLDSISGLTATERGLFVQDDRLGRLWQMDPECRPVRQVPLTAVGKMTDTEDVASTADGSLWVADIGGNRVVRTSVSVVRVPVAGSPVRYTFKYPDGPHDAETLLISPDGKQLLIVTKVASGVSTVFSPTREPRPGGTVPLEPVGTVRTNGLADRNPGKAALLITGGAVSPDGLHLVLRTYSDAWEWDAPDGKLAEALTGLPRKVELPVTKQGEAISYTADGLAFLAAGEQLDPLFKIAIERPRYAPTGAVGADDVPAAPVDRTLVAAVLIGGALLCLMVLVGAVVAERRRSQRRSGIRVVGAEQLPQLSRSSRRR